MKKENSALGFHPILKRKCVIIVSLSVVLGILYPSFLPKNELWIAYTITLFIVLITYGLAKRVRFQYIHKKLRPFIVGRLLQVFASLSFIALVARTIPLAFENEAFIPYSVFWLVSASTVYQFYSIFILAKKAKKEFPDRCEFC